MSSVIISKGHIFVLKLRKTVKEIIMDGEVATKLFFGVLSGILFFVVGPLLKKLFGLGDTDEEEEIMEPVIDSGSMEHIEQIEVQIVKKSDVELSGGYQLMTRDMVIGGSEISFNMILKFFSNHKVLLFTYSKKTHSHLEIMNELSKITEIEMMESYKQIDGVEALVCDYTKEKDELKFSNGEYDYIGFLSGNMIRLKMLITNFDYTEGKVNTRLAMDKLYFFYNKLY